MHQLSTTVCTCVHSHSAFHYGLCFTMFHSCQVNLKRPQPQRSAHPRQVQREALRCRCQFLAMGRALRQCSSWLWLARFSQPRVGNSQHPRRSNNDFGTPATPALQAGAATFQEFIASPSQAFSSATVAHFFPVHFQA